ncbi:hypothetical protein CHARACLAT_033326 [Characodon lateralis]|uniref:Uncharacterized protein n=1 Tax=Characodon lateralis TaxID=208331 RepID=A0ABU7DWX8_9TELE|nr:hypothetical protein [Characodon lateralis]
MNESPRGISSPECCAPDAGPVSNLETKLKGLRVCYIADCDIRAATPPSYQPMVPGGICSSRLSCGTKWPMTLNSIVASSSVQMVQYSANKWSSTCDFASSPT